jgi:peptidyl-dipeptidase Dcp
MNNHYILRHALCAALVSALACQAMVAAQDNPQPAVQLSASLRPPAAADQLAGDAPSTSVSPRANPFAAPSTLPFQMPDFSAIKDSDFAPAFDAGMAEQRREVAAIADNPAPPTFENTLVALERSGRLLDRVEKVFDNYYGTIDDPVIDKLQEEYAPKRAAHLDAIYFNQKLFARIEALYRHRSELALDAESLQLLERYHKSYVHAGAAVTGPKRRRLGELDQQIAAATTRFEETVQKAANDGAVIVDNVAELDGLSPEDISSAAAAAQARGLSGRWLITLQHATQQPALANLKNRALRERLYRASIARGNGGADDNTANVEQIVRLRAERAQLLGYPSYAAYQLVEQGAKTPAAVSNLLTQIVPPAIAAARSEAAENQSLINAQAAAAGGAAFALEPWDWSFYAEQVRAARFGFTDADVRPYFELDRVMKDGLFYAAHELYGISFTERADLPRYDPTLRIFEVTDADGSPLALFIADYFARSNKQGGAWENPYVSQSTLLGLKVVVVNCLNLSKPEPGQPMLMTFDEVTGMFHEMGHALHEMFSAVTYPTLAGTNVPTDFGEYPSQFNEMWARDPKVLAHFARHVGTGEPMPQDLMSRVLAAQTFGEGYLTTESLAASLLDQAWYQLPAAAVPPAAQVMDFEARALRENGLNYTAVPPRYHSPYFSHIFAGGDDYSASYYSYTWSNVLARDSGKWFSDHGGLTRANGDYFRSKILSRGRTQEPEVLFEGFYGKPPEIKPLLDYKGFASTVGG